MGTKASQLLYKKYTSPEVIIHFIKWMAASRLIILRVYKKHEPVWWCTAGFSSPWLLWRNWKGIKICCSIRLHCWLSLQPVPFSIEGTGCVQRCLFFLYLVWKGWAQGRSGSALTWRIKQWMCFQHIPCTFFTGENSIKQSAARYETFNGRACWPLNTGSCLWLIIGGAMCVLLCFYKDHW